MSADDDQIDNLALDIPVGEAVRAWRRHRGWTMAELATSAGPPITKGYLSQLERGVIHTPRRGSGKVPQLARALGIAARDLTDGVMPPESSRGSAQPAAQQPSAPRRSSARPALSIPPEPLTIGQRIDALITAARLDHGGEKLVGDHLTAITREVLALVEASCSGTRAREGA